MKLPRIRNNSALCILAALLLLVACGKKLPSGVLPPEQLEAILYDYHLAQSMISELPASERYTKDLYFDYVYAKHGVSAAQVDSSLVYYARYPKELSAVYLKLADRVEGSLKRVEQEDLLTILRKPKAVEGDSADLWYESRLVQMTPSSISRHFATEVPYDTNFKSNDRLEWSGKVLFIHPDVDSLHRYLHLSLTVKYANDSLTAVDTMLYTTGAFHLAIADTTGYKLRSVSSHAYYKGTDGSDHLLIYDTHLMRYRHVAPADSVASDTLRTATTPTEAVAADTSKTKPRKASKRAEKAKLKQP